MHCTCSNRNPCTFLAMVCSSSLVAVRFLRRSSALSRAFNEAPTVPLHPFPPHFSTPLLSRQPAPPQGLSGQLLLALALPWPPHTLKRKKNKNVSLIKIHDAPFQVSSQSCLPCCWGDGVFGRSHWLFPPVQTKIYYWRWLYAWSCPFFLSAGLR